MQKKAFFTADNSLQLSCKNSICRNFSRAPRRMGSHNHPQGERAPQNLPRGGCVAAVFGAFWLPVRAFSGLPDHYTPQGQNAPQGQR